MDFSENKNNYAKSRDVVQGACVSRLHRIEYFLALLFSQALFYSMKCSYGKE